VSQFNCLLSISVLSHGHAKVCLGVAIVVAIAIASSIDSVVVGRSHDYGVVLSWSSKRNYELQWESSEFYEYLETCLTISGNFHVTFENL
jgi:hypothetical protein